MIERFVDYLQGSMKLSERECILKEFADCPPPRFYKRGYRDTLGMRYYFGNPKSPKALVVASGVTMQSLRNDCKLDSEIIGWILSADGKISRLDLAITEWIEDELITLEDIEKWYTHEEIVSPLLAGGAKQISSLGIGGGKKTIETLYIGNMQKRGRKGIFRAYDKGIELKLSPEIATRIELELKREKAHSVARRLAESNDVAGNFRTHFNVRAKDFERLMDADIVPAIRGRNLVKEDESAEIDRRWDWLMLQVAPALKEAWQKERKAGRGDARLSKFLEASGLLADMQARAKDFGTMKFKDMIERNELD